MGSLVQSMDMELMTPAVEFLTRWEPLSLLVLVIVAGCSAHLLLARREVSSTLGWMGLIWLVPLLGAALYWVFGVNRIRRTATALRRELRRYDHSPNGFIQLARDHEALPVQARTLASLVEQVTRRPLLADNSVQILRNGDEAYPAMLAAIDGAQRSVSLLTYIFDTSPVGRRFIDALARAHARGVQVRVLIDAAGSRYSLPPAHWLLRARGVRVARFMSFTRAVHVNLRNHRKILIVDGALGFTGGMNIRAGHVLGAAPRAPVRDLHFELRGPIVAQLQDVFAEDWQFTAGEALDGDAWFPPVQEAGQVLARCISDGPDEDFDKIRWTVLGAAACARERLQLVTPYFLPDPAISSALKLAAMRGVEVDVVVPQRTNLPLVTWAMWGELWHVLDRGVRVWLSPEPFDHSKLLLVDDTWALIGSANIDPRSLRLNFELCVECHDPALSRALHDEVDARIAAAERLTEARYRGRPLAARLRDGLARLWAPYL